MKRRQVEMLLFSEEELSLKEKQALKETLASSPDLTRMEEAWEDLRGRLSEVEVLSPSSGFVSRWQAFRIRREAALRRRQAWLILAGFGVGALLGCVLLAGTFLQELANPANFAGEIVSKLVILSQRIAFGVRLLRVLIKDLPPILPGIGVSWLASLVAWLIVAWLASLYRFAFVGVRNGVEK